MKNGGLNLKAVDWYTCVFYFEKATELELQLKKAPWSFDNCLMAMQSTLPGCVGLVMEDLQNVSYRFAMEVPPEDEENADIDTTMCFVVVFAWMVSVLVLV